MLDNNRILITGVCGTVGSELIRQLLNIRNRELNIIGIDNNESDLFFIEQHYLNDKRVCFYLADIRDRNKLARVMRGVDIVIHAAAFKHVLLCERSPYEAVQTNILGTQNVISASIENKVKKVIFTSTDKAVNPTNVMGTSKLMCEKIMTAANNNQVSLTTTFTSTRFGNILGSRGSVIPIFRNQIKSGGPVTLTDRLMTRFIMSIEEAVKLVIESVSIAKGGEVFITKMPVIKIKELAEVMIEELAEKYGYEPRDIEISTIGAKPGEKLFEELMSTEEARRSVELNNYFAVLPAFRGIVKDISYDYDELISDKVQNPYSSDNEIALSKDQLRCFLKDNNLLIHD